MNTCEEVQPCTQVYHVVGADTCSVGSAFCTVCFRSRLCMLHHRQAGASTERGVDSRAQGVLEDVSAGPWRSSYACKFIGYSISALAQKL